LGRIRTCYISSPAGTDLEYLRNALIGRGIRVVVPDDLYPDANWSEWISRKFGDVDLVIGVLTSARQSQWVLFELGQAVALGRQIVLIAPPKLAAVPSHLTGFLVVRGSPKSYDAIDFALDQILASPERPPTPLPVATDSSPPLGPTADHIIRQLESALVTSNYRELERFVAEALRKSSGVDIAWEASDTKLGADIAVWSDALQPFTGNPLLIEVKSRFRGTDEMQHAANQLSTAVRFGGGYWGLLLYGHGPQGMALDMKSCPPTILVLSISELIEQLRTRSFTEVIRDLRNRRVHGGER
jgi:hypothetical protein